MEECLVRTEVTVIANNQSAVVSQPSLSKNPVLRKPFVHLCLGSLRVGLVVISSRFAFVRFVERGSRAGEWALRNAAVTRKKTIGSRRHCQPTDSRRKPLAVPQPHPYIRTVCHHAAFVARLLTRVWRVRGYGIPHTPINTRAMFSRLTRAAEMDANNPGRFRR